MFGFGNFCFLINGHCKYKIIDQNTSVYKTRISLNTITAQQTQQRVECLLH